MTLLICQIIFGVICLIGIPAGVIAAIRENGNLKIERRPLPPGERRKQRRLPRDSHAQAYVDGFITAEVLDELGDLFK